MYYIDTKKCIFCGLCADVCPADAIVSLSLFKIDKEKCCGCGECLDACPVKAVARDD